MASRFVVLAQKSAGSVVAACETHASEVEAKLEEQLKPFLKKGETMPHFGTVMQLLARALDAKTAAMVKADAAHEAELGDDDEVRADRDANKARLSDRIVELREVFTGAFGAAVASRVFPGSTPEEPVLLARFAGEAADTLKTVKLPASRIKGAKIDGAEIAAELEQLKGDLEASLKAMAREVKEAQVTLGAKNKAIGAYTEQFTSVAMVASGLLRLVGEAELAGKVKPSARRPGQTEGDAEAEAAPTPAPDK